MADRNQEVFEAVLEALRGPDDPSREELLEIAAGIDPELDDLSGPEFQGRYYLPALNRLRSEAAEDVLCPFCGSGPYQGPKSLALHRRFCAGWDEEDGEPVSGESAYRLALERGASSPRAGPGGAAADAPPSEAGGSAEERTGSSPGARGDGAGADRGAGSDPERCPYCSAAIPAGGDELSAKAVADHLRRCADRPRWDLAETSSRPPPEDLYRILHGCSRRIADRTDERDLFGATDALLTAAEDLYRAFGHEPPMNEAALDNLRLRPGKDHPSWLARIRSALPFGDDTRVGKRG